MVKVYISSSKSKAEQINTSKVEIPSYGYLQGFIDSKHPTVLKFLNIPFATVAKRWRPASKPRPWQGVRDAMKQG